MPRDGTNGRLNHLGGYKNFCKYLKPKKCYCLQRKATNNEMYMKYMNLWDLEKKSLIKFCALSFQDIWLWIFSYCRVCFPQLDYRQLNIRWKCVANRTLKTYKAHECTNWFKAKLAKSLDYNFYDARLHLVCCPLKELSRIRCYNNISCTLNGEKARVNKTFKCVHVASIHGYGIHGPDWRAPTAIVCVCFANLQCAISSNICWSISSIHLFMLLNCFITLSQWM